MNFYLFVFVCIQRVAAVQNLELKNTAVCVTGI